MTAPGQLWNDPGDTFQDRLELWRDLEKPAPGVLAVVQEWIPTRKLDPFRGARCEREEDDFWFASIPGSMSGELVVVCSYWVVRAKRIVRCDLFGSLSWPV